MLWKKSEKERDKSAERKGKEQKRSLEQKDKKVRKISMKSE